MAGLLPKMRWQLPAHAADGMQPVSMAMHIHSSFNEFAGSMDAHLDQAQRNAVDVVWWTDHDRRMSAFQFRSVVHFTSLTNETGDGKPWKWQMERSGPLTTASTGGIVATPASPLDTVAGGSLRLRAQSSSSRKAALRFFAESVYGDWNYQTNLTGQVLYVEVLPEQTGRNGYLELLVGTSFHPARGGRPAGQYSISYRFGGAGAPGSRVANGLLGIVTVPVATGQWNSVVLRLADDIAALWPDMDSRDFGLFALRLGAISTGAPTSGCFDYLRFSRATSGDIPLQVQQGISSTLAGRYPGVTQRQGLEVTYIWPHCNWFGPGITLPDYCKATGHGDVAFLRQIIADIHARGGISSYNHPYGAKWTAPMLSKAEQDQQLAKIGTALLANRALGNDLLDRIPAALGPGPGAPRRPMGPALAQRPVPDRHGHQR